MKNEGNVCGARIRLARLANGLSLQELADYLEESGSNITRAALSKYENDKISPNQKILHEISRILGLDVSFFLQDDCPNYTIAPARPFTAAAKYQTGFDAFVQISLEQYLRIEKLLGNSAPINLPEPITVHAGDEEKVQQFAEELRARWGEPRQGICSVIQMLEDNGFYVFKISDTFDVPFFAGIETGSGRPFLGYTRPEHTDILRENILREIAYLFLKCDDKKELDHMARLFSRTFLLPGELLKQEIGKYCNVLSFWELTLLKQKYGISKVSIRKRLRDTGMFSSEIPPDLRQSNFVSYRRSLDSSRDQLLFDESPIRFQLNVLLAYKNNLITRSQAATMLPKQYIQMDSWDS